MATVVDRKTKDIPASILGQLGNRIQHALRAATPQGQKDIKVAATTMASNPQIDTAKVLPTLGVGEALVSVLDAKGVPTPVQITKVLPPVSRVGPITDTERQAVIQASPLRGRYENAFDRMSAFEMLQQRVAQAAPTSAKVVETKTESSVVSQVLFGSGRRQGLVETATKAVVRQMAGQVGRELLRGLLGGLRR